MTKLLHISSSPRTTSSSSLEIASAFLDVYAGAHPDHEIEHWDLWDGSLPDFRIGASAKMTVFAGSTPEGEQAQAWAAARRVFERFDSADKLLFSVPMWNSSVPYILKQFIDVVSQPGWVFGVDPATGYTGLYAPRPVAIVYTSAVWGPGLPPAFGSDFQSTFFSDWLRWTGLRDLSEVRFHPTLTGDWNAVLADALADAQDLAKRF